ncbi:MAG: hypothetical protein Q8K59_09815 [Nitrosomonas sp.]|nr:hypothetical protein [Nitrosomonas sp.]MDP1951370.1 hypothetical protein [Nitrosomonas sp.]
MNSKQLEILQITQAMFKAAPGAQYLSEFTAIVDNANGSIKQLANVLAETSVFKQSMYSDILTNHAFSTQFVENMVGTLVSTENKASAVSTIEAMLTAGQSRGDVIYWAATTLASVNTTDVNWGAAAQQFNNKVDVAAFYSIDHHGTANTLADLQQVTANVTNLAATVTAAKALYATSSLRAVPGASTLTGADGVNDVFVAVGVTAAGEYSGSDTNFANLTTINSNTTSEIDSGDAFVGGTGYDTLHIYGTADLTGVNLSSIERVVLHSDVTFTTEQMAAFNTAGAEIVGNGDSIMRLKQSGTVTSVDMSNISLQAIGQFDLAASLTAQIDQLGLNQIGTVAAGTDAFIQAATGSLDFTGKTVYGPGSVKDANGTLVGKLDAMPGLGVHLNLVVASVASLIDNMNAVLLSVPGYIVQDKVNLDAASMSLYLGSQTAADVIAAGGNHAFMRGGPFDDTIMGGSGTNFISGNAGNDTITGGALRDFLAGDAGNDIMNGLGGNDLINGEAGDDIISGGAGLDFIMPGDGADTVIVTDDADFISLYSSASSTVTDAAADVIKFTAEGAFVGGPTVIVGFEAARDMLKFESTTSGTGIAGISAAAGNATISAAGIFGFNMNAAAPNGLLILTDSSFIRGDIASANNEEFGFDALLGSFGTPGGAGVGHLIAVGDGAGNTNVYYDSDGSSTANNWQFAVKLIGVAVTDLAANSLQLINELA